MSILSYRTSSACDLTCVENSVAISETQGNDVGPVHKMPTGGKTNYVVSVQV